MPEPGPIPTILDQYGNPVVHEQPADSGMPVAGTGLVDKRGNPINEQQQPETQETGEQLGKEGGEKPQEEEKPLTEKGKAAAAEAEHSETVESNANIAIDELLKNNGDMDPQIFDIFKTHLKKDGITPEKMDEIAELIKKLSEIFKQFDDQVAKYVEERNPEFKNIVTKQKEMKEAICMVVINEHLEAKDIASLITGVAIESKQNPSEKRKDKIQQAVKVSGYDGVMFWDSESGEIIIFDDSLKDSKNLNYKHMIVHEMSHPFVERYLKENEELIKLCDQLMENRSQVLPFVSKHVKTALKGLDNLDADYAAEKQAQPDLDKEKFVALRKNVTMREIVTDYTAIYLQTDGTQGAFLKKCAISAGTNFAKAPKIVEEFHGAIYNAVKKELADKKGNVIPHSEWSNGEEDWEDYGMGGFYEMPEGFSTSDPQGEGIKGLWKEAVGFLDAMSKEAPDMTQPIGKIE